MKKALAVTGVVFQQIFLALTKIKVIKYLVLGILCILFPPLIIILLVVWLVIKK
jgi:hypothetical protein